MSDSKEPQAIPRGPERELKTCALGFSGGKPPVPVPLDLLEQKAKKSFRRERTTMLRAERTAKDTMRANREALYHWRIVPRMLRDVSKRDLSVEVLGAHLPAPARSGDVRQRDSPRGGYFQDSRAGGTSRAGGPSLPAGAGGGGRRRRAGGTAESACWSGFDHGAERYACCRNWTRPRCARVVRQSCCASHNFSLCIAKLPRPSAGAIIPFQTLACGPGHAFPVTKH